MRVQRVVMPGSGLESWTVVGDDHVPVEPVERFLAYLSSIERSPNTVKAYAHDLKVRVDRGVVGLVVVLAAAAMSGCGASGASPSVSEPVTVRTARGWIADNQVQVQALQSTQAQFTSDAQAGDGPAVNADCQAMKSAVENLQASLPVPGATQNTEMTASLEDFVTMTQHCIPGTAGTLDADQIQQAAQYQKEATDDLGDFLRDEDLEDYASTSESVSSGSSPAGSANPSPPASSSSSTSTSGRTIAAPAKAGLAGCPSGTVVSFRSINGYSYRLVAVNEYQIWLCVTTPTGATSHAPEPAAGDKPIAGSSYFEVDGLGHVFVNYPPGNYPGIAIVVPSASPMFIDIAGGSVRPEPSASSVFPVKIETNDCMPSCADGKTTERTAVWDADAATYVLA